MDVDEDSNRPNPKRLSVTGQSTLSVVSHRATALEVCQTIYGEYPGSYNVIERFYEASASHVSSQFLSETASYLFRYENPLVTTTSSTMFADIVRLSRQLSIIDIPRPLAVIYSFFRLKVPDHLSSPWIHALRAWTEVDDINENESFDSHRKAIVEHTLNILVFPDMHTDTGQFHHSTDSFSSPPTPTSPIVPSHPIHPSLPIPGTSLTVPSPFHLRLRIITRFLFNEQGRITHHRDFWDVKDVMGLVPGISLAQWIGTRITARGISYASRAWLRASGRDALNEADARIRELENGEGYGLSPAAEYARTARKSFSDSTGKGSESELI